MILLALIAFSVPQPAPLDFDQEYRSICLVETGGNEFPPTGAHGERGSCQITPTVWHQYSRGSIISAARNPAAIRRIAMQHLHYLARKLHEHGIEPSPYQLAMAWHYGLGRTLRGHYSIMQANYGIRVDRIYDSTVIFSRSGS